MTMDHEIFRGQLPAMAVGALDADEAAALQVHLRTCETCPRELAEYEAASEVMLLVPPKAPRTALREMLRNRVAPSTRTPALRRWSLGPVFMGAALAALLLLNVLSFVQVRALQGQTTALSRSLANSQTVLALVAAPRTHAVTGVGDQASGSLVMNPDSHAAVLILSNLPDLESGKTFQIWLIEKDGGRVSAGLFRSAGGQAVTLAELSNTTDLYGYAGVGVTIEPDGGSSGPTSPPVFTVEF